MSKKTKAFLYNLVGFAVLFISFRYIIQHYSSLVGFWVPATAFVGGTLIAPKFQVVKTHDGEKIYMKWIFIKGVKEVG